MRRWEKAWIVAIFEFLSTVKRPGYLISTFGMPLFVALYGVIIAVPAYFVEQKQQEPSVFGVVDGAGVLRLDADVSSAAGRIPDEVRRALEATGQAGALDRAMMSSQFVFRPYDDPRQAHAALAARSIRGYFAVPADYVATGIVDVYIPDTLSLGGSDVRNAFAALLRQRLLEGRVEPALAGRIEQPVGEVRWHAIARSGETVEGGRLGTALRLIVPLAFMILFLLSLLMSSGYLLQGTAIEKENKVVEVLLASANPDEVLAGKLVGLGAAGLLQMAVWLLFVVIAVAGAVPLVIAAGIQVPWLALGVAAPLFVVAFLFFGSLILGTGSIGSNVREAQQLAMVWSLTAVLPMMLMMILIQDPHGAVARVLTWIPFTAAPLVVLRASLDPGALAWWEVAGPFVLLLACTWLALQLGARLFRVGLLISGARPKFREILRQARLGG